MSSLVLACLACTPRPDDPTIPDPRVAGADATLARLELAQAPKWPDFDPEIDGYAVALQDLPLVVDVIAEPTDPAASVRVLHQDIDGALLGEGPELPLQGANKVVVEVTSADGAEQRTYEVVVLPHEFPVPTVRAYGEQAPGWLFLGTFQSQVEPDSLPRMVMLIDHHGVPRWFRYTAVPAYDFRLQPSGRPSYVGVPGDGEPYTAILLDQDFRELDARYLPIPRPDGTPVFTDTHELLELEDGSVILMGNWIEPRDLSIVGGPVDGLSMHHTVQELRTDGTLAFEWTTRDGIDPLATPVWTLEPNSGAYEYAHLNSVDVDPDDGAWVISVRLSNEVIKVARQPTTVGGRDFAPGEIVWRLGGPSSDFTFVDDGGFFGQHCARALPGDRVLVFDNALYREGLVSETTDFLLLETGDSRAVEYQLDLDAGTATRVFEAALPGSGATLAAGSAQRLDGGHTLVGWGDLPQEEPGTVVATEFDANGDVVMELEMPPGVWSYRVLRFEVR
jgi:hypothetical protein